MDHDPKRLAKAKPHELKITPFRNLFLENREVDIAEILFNYFEAVRSKWPNSWDNIAKTGNLLPRANAFKALMRFLREDVYPDLVGDEFGKVPSKKAFAPYFAKIDLEDDDFTSRNFAPGSGGESTFLRLLRGKISLEDILAK